MLGFVAISSAPISALPPEGRVFLAHASIEASGEATVSAAVICAVESSLQGAGSVGVDAVRAIPAVCALTGGASLQGSGWLPVNFVHTISQAAIGALPDPLTTTPQAGAVLSASAGIVADAIRYRPAASDLIGAAGFEGTAGAVEAAASSIFGSAGLDGETVRVRPASADLVASAIISATSARPSAAAAALIGAASVDAQPTMTGAPSASFGGVAEIVAVPGQILAASAGLIGSAAIDADGLALTVSATLTIGTAQVSADAIAVRAATASLDGSATVLAEANSAFLQLVTKPNVRLVYAAEIRMWALPDRIAA